MKKHQFEEQFEDSEANFSEVVPDRSEERMNGAPLQLLKITRNGKIELNEEALNLIASCGEEVGFVSILGKMRTGKSCLLNRLLGLPGRGVHSSLYSFELTPQSPAAPRKSGFGRSLSLTIPLTVLFSS